VASVSPSPRYIPMPPCPLFHVPRSSSIKLTVPQAWIMKIAQPNYLMAPNFPCSSLFTFKSFICIFMLWTPTDTCLRILSHLFLCGVCFSLKAQLRAWQFTSTCTESTKIWSSLQCQMEIWGSLRYILPQTFIAPCSDAVNLFQGGL